MKQKQLPRKRQIGMRPTWAAVSTHDGEEAVAAEVHAMLRGRHRFRLLVHATRTVGLQDILRDWLGALEWSAKARVAVDVDPHNFL